MSYQAATPIPFEINMNRSLASLRKKLVIITVVIQHNAIAKMIQFYV